MRKLLWMGPCLALLMGCHDEYIPHQNVMGQGYCLYSIVSSTPGAPMKLGQTLCRYCKKLTFPPDPDECPAKTTFTTNDKTYQYDAVATGAVLGCTSCPQDVIDAGRVFEVK